MRIHALINALDLRRIFLENGLMARVRTHASPRRPQSPAEARLETWTTGHIRAPQPVAALAGTTKDRRAWRNDLQPDQDNLFDMLVQKKQLIAFVVHDLKNPVSSIELQTRRVLAEPISENVRDGVLHMQAEAKVLGRMIANLLDLSASHDVALTPDLQVLDLAGLVQTVFEELENEARRHEVELVCALETTSMLADRYLTRRVLGNLLENAIRHAPPNTRVVVHCARRGAGVELRVVDAGAGVPITARDRVFESYAQLDEAGRAKVRAGHGLGLAFVKSAAQAHGGRAWVEDAGPGAAFCVWFPLGHATS